MTHLRCTSADSEEYFTKGKTYKVLETREDTDNYVIETDDDIELIVSSDTLTVVGFPEWGTFEDVSGDACTGDSVQAPYPTSKFEPEFGDIVHVNGVPYVFISIDEDGDYHLINSKGIEVFVDLDSMDEYAHKDSATKLRNLILTDIREFCNNSLEDNMTSVVNFNIPELVDFIMMYKSGWDHNDWDL